MSIERTKADAAKADQMILELAARARGEATQTDGSEGAVVVEDSNTEGSVVAIEDPNAVVPAANNELAQIREDAAKWEQRYRSLDGMIQARDRQIEQLHQLLAGMQQVKAAPEPTPAKAPTALVSERDVETFGADVVDLNRRVAKEELSGYVVALEEKLAALQARLDGVQQTTALSVQDRFEAKLTSLAPKWRTTDADPAFVAWLQEVGMRQRMFAEAARGQDAEGVAYFYNEYASKTPAPDTKPAIDPRLEKQLAPGKTRAVAAAPVQPTDKKQWTRSEIADFMLNGKKRFGADEYNRMYKDVFAAQQEGRVDFSR